MYIIIIVQQLLQLLTGYALNKVSVLLLSQKHFPDICIYCWQFSKAMSQLKYTSQPPFPPPLPPKSMHQVIDIPEMPGISLLLFSFSFFLFPSLFPSLSFFFLVGQGGWGLGKGFPSYSCCNADSVLQYYLPTPIPTQGNGLEKGSCTHANHRFGSCLLSE